MLIFSFKPSRTILKHLLVSYNIILSHPTSSISCYCVHASHSLQIFNIILLIQVVRNAAVKAQQRRGFVQQMPHTRSLSAEPRSQQSVVERDPIPNRGSPSTAKRPDKLFLSSPLSTKKRFRERSPLVKTPVFIPEKAFDRTDGPRRITSKGVVRLRAKTEIDLFEKLISNHIQNNMQTTNL